jgi:L-iditol 2-dehydrogenase
LVSFGSMAPKQTLPVNLGHLHYEEIAILPIYHHTPQNIAAAMRRLAAGGVPVERLVTGSLPLSRLADALQMIADKATLRTLLLPGEGVSA